MNKIVLVGRLTKDPELKTTSSDVNYTNITIAVPRRYKRGEVDFINCVAWRNTAEFIWKYFNKGSMIAVSGSLQVRTWEDDNANRHYVTEVVIDEAEFAGSKNDGQASAENSSGNEEFTPMVGEDEDLPF